MSESTFEQVRLPAALILIILVAFIFLPRGGEKDPATTEAAIDGSTPTAGEPEGFVTETPPATPIPTVTSAPTPKPTRRATPEPAPNARFAAEVLACRSISGSSCNGPLGVLPARATTFTALVRFRDGSAGDAINVVLAGPGGTISGGAFTLQGGGDGYYYSTFTVAGLPTGEYIVTATRNGTEVAQTSFRRGS